MRLPAYPEIGRRITISQGRGVNAPLSANAFSSSRARHCERSEAIQENVKRARDLDRHVGLWPPRDDDSINT
jgi:hypothetical protein